MGRAFYSKIPLLRLGKVGKLVARPWILFAAALLAATAGCGGHRPLTRPPGPILWQQQNASLHDPYADNDLGPAVVGGRPPDFQRPRSEPVRNRWFQESWWAQ